MKKLLLLLFLLFPFNIYAISASSYIVMDMDSGRVLEGKNTQKVSLIASTTKILTAITAIEYGNLDDINVKLYDYVKKGDLLGTVKDNSLYLMFEKDGNVIDYKKYIK
jgi:D-alanyl-D-alanine carboxypeptidase (penicillin-binding protein 5/6)